MEKYREYSENGAVVTESTDIVLLIEDVDEFGGHVVDGKGQFVWGCKSDCKTSNQMKKNTVTQVVVWADGSHSISRWSHPSERSMQKCFERRSELLQRDKENGCVKWYAVRQDA